jgi:uncharacterized membrane protein YoaK (UPF0700 family)
MSRITFLLAWVAGFCDTATFVAGDGIFSAHVTGNFVVFAAQVIDSSANLGSWIKLLTFPVFILAVMTGGLMIDRTNNKNSILLTEALLLLLCGLAAVLVLPEVIIIMAATFAMGLQNAFGKLFAKETHGPTTMMTGNVTQISLDFGNLIRGKQNPGTITGIRKQLIVIGGFLAGCVMGAVLAQWQGLWTLLIPGIAIAACYWQNKYA